MVADLLAVVLHGRELGRVETTEPPVGVGLLILNLGDPHPPPPLPDPEVGPRQLPGPRKPTHGFCPYFSSLLSFALTFSVVVPRMPFDRLTKTLKIHN